MFFFDTNRTVVRVDTEMTESERVALAQRGDENAFVRLAEDYRERVWNTASRFARSRAELEDLVQDLFIRIWRGLPSYRSDAPFENWLMTVTVRGCYDFLRKHRRRRETEFPTDPQEGPDPTDERPARQREQRDAWETVTILLDQLPAKDRVLLVLLDLEERGVAETARLTGWTESNVKVRAHRARKKLREIHDELGLDR